jgi:hypothetical protein
VPSAARRPDGRPRSCRRPASALFVGWLDGTSDRNLLRYVFLSPVARKIIPDWQARARRVLAEFRADSSRHLEDADLQALVEDLRGRSALFAQCWTEHAVVDRTGGERTFDHPRKSRLSYQQIAFALANRPDFKLVMLVPEASRKRQSLPTT